MQRRALNPWTWQNDFGCNQAQVGSGCERIELEATAVA